MHRQVQLTGHGEHTDLHAHEFGDLAVLRANGGHGQQVPEGGAIALVVEQAHAAAGALRVPSALVLSEAVSQSERCFVQYTAQGMHCRQGGALRNTALSLLWAALARMPDGEECSAL